MKLDNTINKIIHTLPNTIAYFLILFLKCKNVIMNLFQDFKLKLQMLKPIPLDRWKGVATFAGAFFLLSSISCKRFIEIDPPSTDLVRATVFSNDQTAIAAVSNIYYLMVTSGYASGNSFGLSYLTGLSADELELYSTSDIQKQFYENQLVPGNSELYVNFWLAAYQHIYRANAIIEGLSNSINITPSLKSQLEGEAKFIRAFSHFNLLNLFGEVPLVLSTDYQFNAIASKSAVPTIYDQIIKDLIDSQKLFGIDYSFIKGERVRPTAGAATALLSRVYLYRKDWVNAEIQSTALIENKLLYDTVPLSSVFLKNSKEAIWQLVRDNNNTQDAITFIIQGSSPINSALSSVFISNFEPLDKRKLNWIASKTTGSKTYYYPNKYKSIVTSPVSEYTMVLRLAEQYLIRSEARAQLGKIVGSNGAEGDLNVIRKRASLGVTTATSKEEMLIAIEKERRVEFFTEWGHRWLDLKRTGRADAILGPLKGLNWQTTDQLFPIPQSEINSNPSLVNSQNPGYN